MNLDEIAEVLREQATAIERLEAIVFALETVQAARWEALRVAKPETVATEYERMAIIRARLALSDWLRIGPQGGVFRSEVERVRASLA